MEFGPAECEAARPLVSLALREDLGDRGDVTSRIFPLRTERASVAVVARERGVLSGLPLLAMVAEEVDREIQIDERLADGRRLSEDDVIAVLSGSPRTLLSAERTALNFLTHLSGIATLTERYVSAVTGTRAKILDTRKTLPGWRVLEKYAVRCGGGTNHRMGLHDGVLIKDNHLAALPEGVSLADAVRTARNEAPAGMTVEVEVDSISQLTEVLPARPDIVLLDNMRLGGLVEAVTLRNQVAPDVLLEASGGVTLETVRGIAETGVDRISIGGLTHSARALDLGFDWRAEEG
ncbi:MAG: carboxylating nicotinate-nucleotide diphosphorylase [Planctomycetota bacterium]|nr:MAG: carboxylating nicotinate-nucleotide diphosphorylase [Planctomycetota bacterium]REJ98444.1 MAG: carboxylating nicotinate-nucleotide diphosphorylase [Planctomycetota bacterium]REK23641.1 MAG: carboxylating nicotinate-nucleotide diphosphorylase [Planctomycetota bacterium]REK31132.1 MAG: carboxylating nicotinate-nucleotide diphosphorylase [Planctomycetota bacterium]